MTLSETNPSLVAGPILFARGADGQAARIGAVMLTRAGDPAPVLRPDGEGSVTPVLRASLFGHDVWGAEFALPVTEAAGYTVAGQHFCVRTDLTGDLSIAFVSCNGQEDGDEDRSAEDRDVMWRRLVAEHRGRPFGLMLQGGDQLYADEAVRAHPEVERWSDLALSERRSVAWTPEMEEAVRGYFFRRYLATMTQPAMAELGASVPSLMIWDDHDIFDGWGSHPADLGESPVALGIFKVAREMFVLFQLGASLDEPPATCPDRSGATFTQGALFPGFAVLLPDLRSERRPTRVMGEAGWRAFEATLAAAPPGDRRILVSSVPALGPRLSLIESFLDILPGSHPYEDDLRDQWQSRAHREEWVRFLSVLEAETTLRGAPVTAVSGEIHLATRAEMQLPGGSVLHQLVASGITHPKPPMAMAVGLGMLSRLGHAPLAGRPVRLKALPGRTATYTADRNYLVLTRRGCAWTGEWELEESGRTPRLSI